MSICVNLCTYVSSCVHARLCMYVCERECLFTCVPGREACVYAYVWIYDIPFASVRGCMYVCMFGAREGSSRVLTVSVPTCKYSWGR